MHSTDKLDDGYLGSGWILKDAIKKHGKENFIREILYICKSRKDAREKEAELVNEDFVSREDTYNLVVGGIGGGDNQWGEKNHMYGKKAHNSKRIRAIHKDGTIIETDSIESLSAIINMARGNIRNLLQKQIRGKRGWSMELY